MGSGPAGEVTFADVKQRLAATVARYVDAAQLARDASIKVAAARDAGESNDAHSE